MKAIFLLLATLSYSTFHSQQVYPLNDYVENAPRGSYFKDLNGELIPFIGLWKGSWNGKTIYIDFRKIKYYLGTTPTNGIYQDKIVGERKIINSNGVIEMDRITNFDNNPYHEFIGIKFKYSNPTQKQIYFAPHNMCGKTANLDITFLDTAKTQMSLHLIYNPSIINDSCPYYDSVMQGNDFPINFPKDIVLTKQ